MDDQTRLLTEIEAFIRERGIAETTFGRLAVNDGKFVRRLRERQNMTLATLERARDFIREERAKRTASGPFVASPRPAAPVATENAEAA